MHKHDALALADVAAAGVRLRPTDAATIVCALVRQIENRTLPGVPSAHVIRLSAAGEVTVEGPVVATGAPVPRAAQLLADLLPKTTRARSDTALNRVIDLALRTPPEFATVERFGEALKPFAAHDAKAAIAQIVARWAAAAGSNEGWDPVTDECDPSVSDIRRARRETGLSLDEVSRKSRIPVSLLRQLEWGYLRNWPKGMYGRTQLARYARAAGLERQVVLDAIWPLIEHEPVSAPAPAPPSQDGSAIVIVQPTFKADEVLFETEAQPVDGSGPRPADDRVAATATAAPLSSLADVKTASVPPAIAVPASPAAHEDRSPVRAADPMAASEVPLTLLDPLARPETPRRASLIGAAAVLTLAAAGGLWGMRGGPPDHSRVTMRAVRRVPSATEISARHQAGDSRATTPPMAQSEAAPAPLAIPDARPILRAGMDERVLTPIRETHAERAEDPDDESSTSAAFASAGGVSFAEPAAVGTSGDTTGGLGLRLTQVVDDRGRNYHARPSPNGSMVAFDSDREGERGVYLADAGGRNLRRVSGDGFAALPSWSPDGRTIAYVRAEPDNPNVWNLWSLNLDSGQSRRLTANASGRPQGASWFPDSRRVAYAVGNRIMVLDLTTGAPVEYPSPQSGRKPGAPAVSPDGRLMIFALSGDGAWLTDLSDGSSRKVLSDPSAGDFTWSPDGTRVAYYSRHDREWGVWIAVAR